MADGKQTQKIWPLYQPRAEAATGFFIIIIILCQVHFGISDVLDERVIIILELIHASVHLADIITDVCLK